jgi:hypothetical protein
MEIKVQTVKPTYLPRPRLSNLKHHSTRCMDMFPPHAWICFQLKHVYAHLAFNKDYEILVLGTKHYELLLPHNKNVCVRM